MELVTALVATVGTIGATAAPAAGAVAATSAISTSTVLTALTGIGTAFSALATIGAGASAKMEADAAAKDADLAARAEKSKGEMEAARLTKHLALTLQQQKVAFAAGGVDLGSVSVSQARTQATHAAEQELGISANNTLRKSLADQAQARALRAKGKTLLTSSLFEAGGKIATFGAEAYARG